MMKYKEKGFQSTVLIVVVILVLIAAANFLGIDTMRSATRIGYVGHDGWRNWSASYTMLDGKMKHTIHPEDTQKALHVEVVTEGGSISIKMKDANGNIVFDEDNIGTSTFDIETSEKIVVFIEADKHKGSFSIATTK